MLFIVITSAVFIGYWQVSADAAHLEAGIQCQCQPAKTPFTHGLQTLLCIFVCLIEVWNKKWVFKALLFVAS